MSKKSIYVLILCMTILAVYYLGRAYNSIPLLELIRNLFLVILLIKVTDENIKKLEYRDTLTFFVMGLGLFVNLLIGMSMLRSGGGYSILLQRLGFSIGGLLTGGISFYLLGFLAEMIFKKEGVGGGDVKLVAAIGAFIGPSVVWLIPIWICMLIVFGLTYKVVAKFSRSDSSNVVPSAPIHFITLISFLLIKANSFDIISGLMVLFVAITYAFLLAKYWNRSVT